MKFDTSLKTAPTGWIKLIRLLTQCIGCHSLAEIPLVNALAVPHGHRKAQSNLLLDSTDERLYLTPRQVIRSGWTAM